MKHGWIITNPDWGYLAIPRFPSMWMPDPARAHVFKTRRKALKESARWARGLTTVEEVQ